MKLSSNRLIFAVALICATTMVSAQMLEITPEDEKELVTMKQSELKQMVNRLLEAQVIIGTYEKMMDEMLQKLNKLQKSTNCV